MSSLVVLMYHALYENDHEFALLDDAERPYAVSLAGFRRQMALLADAGISVLDPAAMPTGIPEPGSVLITFDDGHSSNVTHALPVLDQHGYRAAFFVTSDFVGKRSGFCTWSQVRDLVKGNMLVGAHGKTHRFFDDLSHEEASLEFHQSRDRIEQEIGSQVIQMSFPGGRFRKDQLSLGVQAGFELFHSSRIGLHRTLPTSPGAVMCRIPVRTSTDERRFIAYSRGDVGVLMRERLLSGGKLGLRRVIGNRAYHYLYETLAKRRG